MNNPADLGPIEPKRGIPEVEPDKMAGQPEAHEEPTKSFDSVMEQGTTATAGEKAPSPMELAASQGNAARAVTPDSLNGQVGQIQQGLGKLQEAATPERLGKLNDEGQTFVHQQLTQFHQSMNQASQHLGMQQNFQEPPQVSSGAEKFLSWITGAQKSMQQVGTNLGSETKGSISPAKMLKAQAQLMAADRSINFATACMSLGIQGIKQLMQTQI